MVKAGARACIRRPSTSGPPVGPGPDKQLQPLEIGDHSTLLVAKVHPATVSPVDGRQLVIENLLQRRLDLFEDVEILLVRLEEKGSARKD